MMNPFCVGTVASLGLASVGRSSVISGLTGAAVNHRLKDLRNVPHILDAPDQLIDRCLRQAFDVNTLPRLVIPKIQ